MFSSLWHRVEAVRPRLRPQTQIERHVVRGEIWYYAKDRLANRVHRFSPAVYAVLMRLNGERTLGEIWAEVADHFGEDAPSQDQIIQLVGQLYSYDLVQVEGSVDMGELSDRADRLRRRQLLQRYQNPMYFRLPLFDPDRFLDATVGFVRPFASIWGAALWLIAVGWFVAEAGQHWTELTTGIADRVLATDNLLLLVLIFPILKILHELGHAYATKLSGGEVHDVGIMFLVMMPMPYVDASASSLFPAKWSRVLVGAAGMLVELFVASIAMFVWLSAEAGAVRALAFNTMLIASVSTVAFNGNPLLRFDAYYIISDLLEIPNLANRATLFWAYLAQRFLFGAPDATNPVSARGEAVWFTIYAPAALVYRLLVLFSIASFVGARFFFIGALLAIWTIIMSIGWPLFKALKFIFTAPVLTMHRRRAVLTTAGLVVTAAILLFVLPLPNATVVRGVVWIPDNARVTTQTNGTVVKVLCEAGASVIQDQPLFELEDPYLAAQRSLAQAKLAELQQRLLAAEASTPYETEVLRKQIELAKAELAEANRKFTALTVRSPADGIFIVPNASDIPGTYAKKGQPLGFVMPPGEITVRTAVPEDDFDIVHTQTKSVAARLDGSRAEVRYNVPVARLVPQATHQLPSPALSQKNNGPFAIDPTAKEQDTSLLPFFELDVTLPVQASADHWGERAWVRFDHGATPIALRFYRSVRQVFLKRFNA
jgi:putative peptide zinc metalloprotease protein